MHATLAGPARATAEARIAAVMALYDGLSEGYQAHKGGADVPLA